MRYELQNDSWDDLEELPGADDSGQARVRLVKNAAGVEAVAKVFKHTPRSQREALVAAHISLVKVRNIVEHLDSGEVHLPNVSEPWYVIIMPRAEKSLAAHIRDSGGLSTEESIRVLRDVAMTLEDLKAVAVHRDIKPANVLKFGEEWRLTDFGIARIMEESTATHTWKGAHSSAYAAPETIRGFTASSATDVYSFGVMAYELIEGSLPFLGPDYASQHLSSAPPTMQSNSPQLRALIFDCLNKEPATRPTPLQIQKRLLNALTEDAGTGVSALAEANAAVTEAENRAQAVNAAAQKEEEIAQARFERAEVALKQISEDLITKIELAAPKAQTIRGAGHGMMQFVSRLGAGSLGISIAVRSSPWPGRFPVIASAQIVASCTPVRPNGVRTVAHSLWYCDPNSDDSFSWFDLAFDSGLIQSDVHPKAYSPERFGSELSVDSANFQATHLEEVDHVAPTKFASDWLGLFAQAVEGNLPRIMGARLIRVEIHDTLEF